MRHEEKFLRIAGDTEERGRSHQPEVSGQVPAQGQACENQSEEAPPPPLEARERRCARPEKDEGGSEIQRQCPRRVRQWGFPQCRGLVKSTTHIHVPAWEEERKDAGGMKG